ncbi:MAG: glucose-6-phosphate dehydrogenase (NADP(+)) [Mycobacteriaceae bacterium]
MPDATTPGPTIFVLYGATGDLAKRMVLPAFFELAIAGLLPSDWRLVGNGRGDVSHWDFQEKMHAALTEFGPQPEDGPWEEFRTKLLFAGGGFEKDDPGSMLAVLAQAKAELGDDAQHVHYLAVPPVAFGKLTEGIGAHGLAKGSRVVYEKPFGTSPEEFRELDKAVHAVLDEEQVYRIDHFLGKEATQNLHVLRFANSLIADVWNNRHVAQVQIDVPETLGIADRAEFYDATGAVLDMLVTHLFQVAAEVAMEPPISLDAEDLQSAREEVIAAFRPLDPSEVVLGQFEGYTETEGIADDSTMDTFVAARLWVDTDRWHGVPFLLRTGKELAVGAQTVSLVLREPDGPLKGVPSSAGVLQFSLTGDGEISLSVVLKEPGPELKLTQAATVLKLDSVEGGTPLPPYARLLHDVLLGDRSLYTRPDGLAHVWEVAQPLLDARPPVQGYAKGSMGPEAADELARPGRWLITG